MNHPLIKTCYSTKSDSRDSDHEVTKLKRCIMLPLEFFTSLMLYKVQNIFFFFYIPFKPCFVLAASFPNKTFTYSCSVAVGGWEEKLVRHLIKTQTNIPTTVYGSQTMHLKCPEFQVFFQKDFDCIDSVLIFSKKNSKAGGL